MKKIFLSAVAITLLCGMLFACAKGGDVTTAAATDAPKVTTTEKPKVTPAPTLTTATPPSTGPVSGAYTLADGSKFSVDGKLDEWDGYKTVVLQGEGAYAHKKAVFYACYTDLGLFLACDAYHDEYISGVADWWKNSNFEFFIGFAPVIQYYVYADGIGNACLKNNNVDDAVMVTYENEGNTKYHTITEVFIATDNLPTESIDPDLNTVMVGVAWKTIGDLIIGGAAHVNEDGSDEYWVPIGGWPNQPYLTATPEGLINEMIEEE